MFVGLIGNKSLHYTRSNHSSINLAWIVVISIVEGYDEQSIAPGLKIALVQHWSDVCLQPVVRRLWRAVMSIVLKIRHDDRILGKDVVRQVGGKLSEWDHFVLER